MRHACNHIHEFDPLDEFAETICKLLDDLLKQVAKCKQFEPSAPWPSEPPPPSIYVTGSKEDFQRCLTDATRAVRIAQLELQNCKSFFWRNKLMAVAADSNVVILEEIRTAVEARLRIAKRECCKCQASSVTPFLTICEINKIRCAARSRG